MEEKVELGTILGYVSAWVREANRLGRPRTAVRLSHAATDILEAILLIESEAAYLELHEHLGARLAQPREANSGQAKTRVGSRSKPD